MEVKQVRVTNCKQFELLVARMEAHPAVARGVMFCQASRITKERYTEIWKDLATGLNSLGPPTRSVHEWQKVWTDFKLKVKRKLTHNKRETEATGGGPNQTMLLTSIEEAVVNLLSLDRAIDQSGPVFGLPIRESSSPNNTLEGLMIKPTPEQELNDIEYAGSSNDGQNKRKRTLRHTLQDTDNRLNMLEKQTKFLKQMAENSAETARYTKKIFKLKEEEVKENQAYRLRKEKQRQDELQYNLQLLAYKERKLNLLERQVGQKND
ncbi:uncharacterized protein LOC129773011 [Toxorhynchites rutilus septentrionalis]|uniref:uncharacterized protein LOC129773011 n=1 Tax=Toxorhynchites rutilus septentrionalis TaxID=329112 RepID=UPI00247A5355|nr:uncharacterized protein LOC129773011 [Toxorhynchites rutilus septentrionalis]